MYNQSTKNTHYRKQITSNESYLKEQCPSSFVHTGEENAFSEQMWKFAILIKAKFQDALNYRAENTKGRVGKHFLPMYSAELKEKEFGKK